jgi:hypothetical protein
MHIADDYNATYTYFMIRVNEDDLQFGLNSDPDILQIKGEKYFDFGPVTTAPSATVTDHTLFWVADVNGTAGKAGLHMMAESGAVALIVAGVEYKTTTGDSASVHEGKFQINTFDNNVKIYAEGAWRQLATW